MRISLLFLLTLSFSYLFGQTNDERIDELQDRIAQTVGELKSLGKVNYMKHVNQVEGYKQGLWLESTNGELWFTNYELGLRHGDLTIYYTSGKVFVKAKYDMGELIDKVSFFDSNGVLLKTYENIQPNDSTVERKREKVEGGKIYFTREKHRYDYKAYVKKYMSNGALYKEGYGLVDRNWFLSHFEIGEWEYAGE